MTEQTRESMKYIIETVSKMAGAENQENAKAWATRLEYCVKRMGEEEYGRAFLHNIAVYMGLDTLYREINDSVVQLTLRQLLEEVSPLIGLQEHPIFHLPNIKSRETVLPGGKWLLRKRHSKVCRFVHSYAVYVSNDEADSAKEISRRMDECKRVIEESKK